MEPIVPITKPEKSAVASPAQGTLADLIATLLSSLAAVIALGYSTIFFSRFLENDTHPWGILSAFLLCFGIGAFAYVPAALTSFIAWRSYKNGAVQRGLRFSIMLLMPWIILSLALVFVSDLPKIYSLPILLTALTLTAWALISLRIFHSAN